MTTIKPRPSPVILKMQKDFDINNDVLDIIKNLTREINALKDEIAKLRSCFSVNEKKSDKIVNCENDEGLLSINDLIEIIPGKPSIQSIRRWIREEALPHQRFNRKLFFNKNKVLEWVNKRTNESFNDYSSQTAYFVKSTKEKTKAPWRV